MKKKTNILYVYKYVGIIYPISQYYRSWPLWAGTQFMIIFQSSLDDRNRYDYKIYINVFVHICENREAEYVGENYYKCSGYNGVKRLKF